MNMIFIIIGVILIIYIIKSVMNKNFDIYESIFWIFAIIAIMFLSLFPKSFDSISLKIGISYSPSLVFLLAIVFLLFINFKHSRLISNQRKKIIELTQNLSILTYEVKEMEQKNEK